MILDEMLFFRGFLLFLLSLPLYAVASEPTLLELKNRALETRQYADQRKYALEANRQNNVEETLDALFSIMQGDWQADKDRAIRSLTYDFGIHIKIGFGWPEKQEHQRRLEIYPEANRGKYTFEYVLRKIEQHGIDYVLRNPASPTAVRNLAFRSFVVGYGWELENFPPQKHFEKPRIALGPGLLDRELETLTKAFRRKAQELKASLAKDHDFEALYRLETFLRTLEKAPDVVRQIEEEIKKDLDYEGKVLSFISHARQGIEKLNVPETNFPIGWPNIFVHVAKIKHPAAIKFLEQTGRNEMLRFELRLMAYGNLVYISHLWKPEWIVILHTLSETFVKQKRVGYDFSVARTHVSDVFERWWEAEPGNPEIIAAVKAGLPTARKYKVQPPIITAQSSEVAQHQARVYASVIRKLWKIEMKVTIRSIPTRVDLEPVPFTRLILGTRPFLTDSEFALVEPILDKKVCAEFLSGKPGQDTDDQTP